MARNTQDAQPHLSDESDFLNYAADHGFGDIHFKVNKAHNFKAIVAIHSTKLGPSLGGCRFLSYPNTADAILDAMRLARGMSYKAALAKLPLGGGKAVVIKPHGSFDRKAFFDLFGQFVNELGGRYITALDSGSELDDMDIIAKQTNFVASRSIHDGDPSPHTAQGIFNGIQAAVAYKLRKNALTGLRVAIQGLGHVGFQLAHYLHESGAQLIVADINPSQVDKAVKQFGAKKSTPEEIHKVECDVFSPCALGATINDVTIQQLNTTIIAGAANNQLAHTYHGQILHDLGILYAVDYVINAGGLIFAASCYLNTPSNIVQQQLDGIFDTLTEIFNRSQQENLPTSLIADKMAEELLV